ncbi:MAG: hypothetical protein NVV74_24125 [Magnetospirillum sp.]|nr:hypothetical protein [Magnetospirillum sp.]
MGGYVQAGLQVAQLAAGQQQARKAAQAQANQVAAQNQYLAQQQELKAKQQRDLMARQLASTRARLAAGGMGVGGGSSRALLEGMVRDSESDLADSTALLKSRQDSAADAFNTGSAADGLQQGLSLVQKGWDIFRSLPG